MFYAKVPIQENDSIAGCTPEGDEESSNTVTEESSNAQDVNVSPDGGTKDEQVGKDQDM